MSEAMTPLRLKLLMLIDKNPDQHRDRLLALKGVQPADLAFLEQHDLIREREAGCCRITHLGQLALKRGQSM
jgi:hypothetical protein